VPPLIAAAAMFGYYTDFSGRKEAGVALMAFLRHLVAVLSSFIRLSANGITRLFSIVMSIENREPPLFPLANDQEQDRQHSRRESSS
jgi:hypothetical protein